MDTIRKTQTHIMHTHTKAYTQENGLFTSPLTTLTERSGHSGKQEVSMIHNRTEQEKPCRFPFCGEDVCVNAFTCVYV